MPQRATDQQLNSIDALDEFLKVQDEIKSTRENIQRGIEASEDDLLKAEWIYLMDLEESLRALKDEIIKPAIDLLKL